MIEFIIFYISLWAGQFSEYVFLIKTKLCLELQFREVTFSNLEFFSFPFFCISLSALSVFNLDFFISFYFLQLVMSIQCV